MLNWEVVSKSLAGLTAMLQWSARAPMFVPRFRIRHAAELRWGAR